MPPITLVTLGVADLPAATAFYEALGWRRSAASVVGTVAFFHGTPVLALFGRGELAEDAQTDLAAPPAAVALAINLEDQPAVDRLLAAAEAAGASIPKPAAATEWGGYSGYFADLDGHLWEVAHNPHWELRADGQVALPT